MKTGLEKFCLTVIQWGSYLILFIPLLFYRYTLFPYIFPKIIAFQILTEIISVAWLFLIISGKKYRPNFKNPLILSLTIFVGILFLTMLTGVDISRSFWGTTERMTGFLTMFHFYLWFLILTSCFNDWKDWRKFIWITLFISFLVGAQGLVQIYKLQGVNLKLLIVDLLKGGGGRVGATLGNPIFLAVFAMLHIFLAGLLVLTEKKRFWKGLALFLLVFNLIIMLLGASRGVILSFSLSLFLFFVILIFLLSSPKIKIFLICLVIIMIGGVVFLLNQKDKSWVSQSPYFLQRMIHLTEDIWARTLTWQIAYQGFKENPILGWGWENFNIVFNKYYNPRYLEIDFSTTWYDKSHNQIMDILSLTGILGFFSYLAVFFFLFKSLYQKFKKEVILTEKLTIEVLGLMFFAYFVQNLFVFDTPNPLIVFYFSLGLVYFITQGDTNIHTNDTDKIKRARTPNNFSLPVLISLTLIFLPIAIYEFNLKHFWQSKFAFQAANISLKDFELGLGLYQKALGKSTFINSEIRLQLLKSAMAAKEDRKTSPTTSKKGFEFAISEMEKSVKEHPLDARYHLYLGKFYNIASDWDKNYLEKAEKTLERALELSPKRQEVYYDFGLTKLMLKKNDEAIELYKKAVSLDEKINKSYWYLGLAYLSTERYEEGLVEIEKAGYEFTKDPNTLLFIARAYDKISNYDKAIFLADTVLSYQPENLNAKASKAVYLVKAGKKSEALKLIEEISEINPRAGEELRKKLSL